MPDHREHAIRVVGLTAGYGSRTALDDVSFATRRGRFCALLGPNGSGKSTLFALLTHLILPRRGTIEVLGTDLLRHPRDALAQMGIVFQQSTLDLEISVRRNLTYFAALQGISGRAGAVAIERALDRLDLRDRAGERVRDLNGGHRRRTEIARALVHDPRLLLLDEPTVGLDAASRTAITRHVHEMSRDQGLSVLWATHLVDEIDPTDDVILLHRGKVRAQGTAAEICAGQPLAERFLAITADPA